MKGLKSTFIELEQATPTYDKRFGIHENGDNNSYPTLVEETLTNSVTATRCAETMSSYVAGKGFGKELNRIIVNKHKNITLLKLLQDTADSIAEQKGFFIQVNYTANYKHASYEVLPFSYCRLGKRDDTDYTGKILVCPNWKDSKLAKLAHVIDVYNPTESVIKAQVDKAGGWKKYKGQILYVKFGRTMYPYAPIHSVLFDAISEKNSSIYKATSLEDGFFGKTLVVTPPLVDPALDADSEEYFTQNTARDDFKGTLESFMGAKNNKGVMHVELEFDSDDIDKSILFKNVETNLNDKLFEYTEKSASENICIAYGINPNLIRPTNAGLFSQSGEAYKQMKLDYQEHTEDYRMIVEQTFNDLFKRFYMEVPELTIVPRIEIKTAV